MANPKQGCLRIHALLRAGPGPQPAAAAAGGGHVSQRAAHLLPLLPGQPGQQAGRAGGRVSGGGDGGGRVGGGLPGCRAAREWGRTRHDGTGRWGQARAALFVLPACRDVRSRGACCPLRNETVAGSDGERALDCVRKGVGGWHGCTKAAVRNGAAMSCAHVCACSMLPVQVQQGARRRQGDLGAAEELRRGAPPGRQVRTCPHLPSVSATATCHGRPSPVPHTPCQQSICRHCPSKYNVLMTHAVPAIYILQHTLSLVDRPSGTRWRAGSCPSGCTPRADRRPQTLPMRHRRRRARSSTTWSSGEQRATEGTHVKHSLPMPAAYCSTLMQPLLCRVLGIPLRTHSTTACSRRPHATCRTCRTGSWRTTLTSCSLRSTASRRCPPAAAFGSRCSRRRGPRPRSSTLSGQVGAITTALMQLNALLLVARNAALSSTHYISSLSLRATSPLHPAIPQTPCPLRRESSALPLVAQ